MKYNLFTLTPCCWICFRRAYSFRRRCLYTWNSPLPAPADEPITFRTNDGVSDNPSPFLFFAFNVGIWTSFCCNYLKDFHEIAIFSKKKFNFFTYRVFHQPFQSNTLYISWSSDNKFWFFFFWFFLFNWIHCYYLLDKFSFFKNWLHFQVIWELFKNLLESWRETSNVCFCQYVWKLGVSFMNQKRYI